MFWNNEGFNLEPTDYEIHTFSAKVTAMPRENKLHFLGTGDFDTYGLTIDNIKVIPGGTTENICVNPGFEEPHLYGGWSTYNDIKGWKGDSFEIGDGRHYNSRWNSQVCELDSSKNTFLFQTFDLNTS